MATLNWQRDIQSEASGVQNTFSSWDSCMSEAYCKWPAIIGIIIGSLIVISIIWCCARCLCCGAECCCGCLSCFNRCCPSPRRGRNSGYEKPQSYPPNTQYQSPAPPMYFGGGYRAPQTATFDAPGNKNYNEDSLPAMPTWSTAQSRKVEEEVELEKLENQQQQGLLHRRDDSADSVQQDGDSGRMQAAPYQQQPSPYQAQNNAYQNTAYQSNAYQNNGYGNQASTYYGQPNPYQDPTSPHEYSQHQQFAGSPTSPAAPSAYPPTYHTRPPSSVYTTPYSAGPPGYQTAPPSIASALPQRAQVNGYAPQNAQPNGYGMGRTPASGSWRDV